MKSILFIAFLIVSFSVQSKDTISWCAYYNWPPWIYPAGDGYDGILIEQLKQFEKDHNIKGESIIIKNWKRCQIEVSEGRIDMLLGAYKTPNRMLKFTFLSKPSLINESKLNAYTAFDNAVIGPINGLDDLAKLRLVIDRGNSHGIKIDEFISKLNKENLITVNTMDQALNLIILKRFDYFFTNNSQLLQMADKYAEVIPGLSNFRFRIIYTIRRETPAYIAFPIDRMAFDKFGTKWHQSLANYSKSVDLKERKYFHNANSLIFAK